MSALELSPADLTIDELTPADLPDVERIEQESFSSPWPRQSFEAALAQDHCLGLAARLEGVLVGYLIAVLHSPTVLIANIAIERDSQRKRVGSRLLERAFETGTAAGCNYSVLDVRPSNKAAIHLYERLGFRPVGRRPSYYRNPEEDALTMARLL